MRLFFKRLIVAGMFVVGAITAAAAISLLLMLLITHPEAELWIWVSFVALLLCAAAWSMACGVIPSDEP